MVDIDVADYEVLVPFEQKRLEAEAAKVLAEAEKLTAQAETARYQATVARLQAEMAEREHAYNLADDTFNRVYKFNGAVTAASVNSCQRELSRWSRMFPKADLEIVFNSPGGSVFDGMALFDFITQLRSAGHYVTTSCRGMAASMGGILLQAGDKRVIGPESYILIHEISTLTAGKLGELQDEIKFMEKISERVIKIFTTRSNLTAAQIKKRWKKTDWWVDADESLKLGLVDEIG